MRTRLASEPLEYLIAPASRDPSGALASDAMRPALAEKSGHRGQDPECRRPSTNFWQSFRGLCSDLVFRSVACWLVSLFFLRFLFLRRLFVGFFWLSALRCFPPCFFIFLFRLVSCRASFGLLWVFTWYPVGFCLVFCWFRLGFCQFSFGLLLVFGWFPFGFELHTFSAPPKQASPMEADTKAWTTACLPEDLRILLE